MKFLFLIISFITFEVEAQNFKVDKVQSPPTPVVIGKTSDGQITFMAKSPNGQLVSVSMEFLMSNLIEAIETAKKVVCELSVLPQSVTVSSVLVSVTYETKQFCPKEKFKTSN